MIFCLFFQELKCTLYNKYCNGQEMAVDRNIENLQFLTKPTTQSGEKYLITFDVNVEQSYTWDQLKCVCIICLAWFVILQFSFTSLKQHDTALILLWNIHANGDNMLGNNTNMIRKNKEILS